MFYVYILRSKTKESWTYVGFSEDLKTRIKSHNEGKNSATKPYKPFDLLYYEAFRNKLDALRREKYLKTSKGRRSLRLILTEEF